MPTDEQLVKRAFEKTRTRGILLHRPYPPLGIRARRSKFGGLPTLPQSMDWPIGADVARDGTTTPVPLHFLCQIDCSELPRIGNELPRRGMLFFFGRDDEEQDWGYTKIPAHDAVVLFADDVPSNTPPRTPPSDLPPIGGAFAAPNLDHGRGPRWLLPDEEGPKTHTEWPVVALAMDCWRWSDLAELGPGRLLELCRSELPIRNLDAFERATRTKIPQGPYFDWSGANPITNSAQSTRDDDAAFPQLGIMVDRFARYVVREALECQRNGAPCQSVIDAGYAWLMQAREIGPFNAPTTTTRRQLHEWIAELDAIRIVYEGKFSQQGYNVNTKKHINLSVIDAICATATVPEIARKIPALYFETLEPLFLRPQTRFDRPIFNRLLAPCQNSVYVEGPGFAGRCLLQLTTDVGLGREFGDMGQCEFWIENTDLQSRKYNKAWGVIH